MNVEKVKEFGGKVKVIGKKVKTTVRASKGIKIGLGLAFILGIGIAALEITEEKNGYANPIEKVIPTNTTVSRQEALDIVHEKTNKPLKSIELEINEKGEKLFEVEFYDDSENMYVHAESGITLTKEDIYKNIKISEEEAKSIALKSVQGTIVKVELDEDDGYATYEVEVMEENGNDVDVEISAENGKIIEIDR